MAMKPKPPQLKKKSESERLAQHSHNIHDILDPLKKTYDRTYTGVGCILPLFFLIFPFLQIFAYDAGLWEGILSGLGSAVVMSLVFGIGIYCWRHFARIAALNHFNRLYPFKAPNRADALAALQKQKDSTGAVDDLYNLLMKPGDKTVGPAKPPEEQLKSELQKALEQNDDMWNLSAKSESTSKKEFVDFGTPNLKSDFKISEKIFNDPNVEYILVTEKETYTYNSVNGKSNSDHDKKITFKTKDGKQILLEPKGANSDPNTKVKRILLEPEALPKPKEEHQTGTGFIPLEPDSPYAQHKKSGLNNTSSNTTTRLMRCVGCDATFRLTEADNRKICPKCWRTLTPAQE